MCIDTAPLIYFLEGDRRRARGVREVLGRSANGDVDLVVSVITEAELLVGPLSSDDPTLAATVRDLLDGEARLISAPVTRAIAQEAAAVRAELGLTLADAMIVATAVDAGCTALLSNDVGFKRLRDVEYLHLDDLLPSR